MLRSTDTHMQIHAHTHIDVLYEPDTDEHTLLCGGVAHMHILLLSPLNLSHSAAPLEIYTSHPTHPLHSARTHTLFTLTHENTSFFPVFLLLKNENPAGSGVGRWWGKGVQGGASGITLTQLSYHCFPSDLLHTQIHIVILHTRYHHHCRLCFSPTSLSNDIRAGGGLDVDPIWCE